MTRGRPRSSAAREAILNAAFAILADRGYGALTFPAVASASGAGRTTIYRWWRSRADLAADAFLDATRAELDLPDTGSAQRDFAMQIAALATFLNGSRGAVFAALLSGGRTDPDLARSLGKNWLEPRRQWGIERMERAVARGECHPGLNVQAALGILYGPLYTPLLFGRGVLSELQVKAHLAIALPAIFSQATCPEVR